MRSPLRGNPRISCDTPCHGYPATDWAVPEGTPVYATHDGVFRRRGPYPQLGKLDPGLCADIEGANGDFSRSAHMSAYVARDGQEVVEGQLVAYSGNTGYSTGPHVHSYVIVNGTRWGVYEYLNSIGYDWAGSEPQPLNETEDDMKLIRRTGSNTLEWSLFHPSLRGATDLERGYITTTDRDIAAGWARTWAPSGLGSEKSEPRDVYIGMQAAARITHDAYQRGLPASSSNAEVLAAIAKVPTAQQNGQAARAAIVK